MEDIVRKMLDLVNKVQYHSGELVLWLLFSLCRAGPASLTALVSPQQLALKERFGLNNPYFIHLLCQLGFNAHSCVDASIINELLEIRINK